MKTNLDILNELAATASRNEKKLILGRYGMNEELKLFFKLALDPFTNFYIKKIPKYLYNPVSTLTDYDAMNMLGALSTRQVTGTAAINYLNTILNIASEDTGELIKRIIAKDPKCGVAESTVNEIWPNLIPEFPVMKATAYDEKSIKNITFPAYSQTKVDGSRCQAIPINGAFVLHSSNGRPFDLHDMFNAGLADDFGTDYVLDGELVVVEGDGKLMDRKKGNGLINKAIHGTLPYEVAKRVHFIIFDIIPIADWNAGYCATPYEDRLRLLVDKCSNKRYNFSIVNTKIVNNEREAYKHFTELYEGGEEGTILKDKKNVWEGKRSKTQIKYKGVITCDLQVVGYLEGTGKYAGKIGSLECVSSDGLVEVSVGSGLSDKDRDIPFSEWKGSIVEVAYNERIKAKTNDAKWSLYLPRFLGRRFDKDEADSIDNIPFKRVKK